ncbi:hypothetical protein [Epilithonimonas vandammei]|uniref:hypothetical protein n=1 Tax=Epilithonimonas vandammei TaxID=2487072 RepID=UPI0028B057CA|nr:hypothetical protein [Epilithonimonas vandammei]
MKLLDKYSFGNNSINNAKIILHVILYISILAELVFFPSWENVLGCIMMWVVLKVFCFLFHHNNIVRFPFAFAMYLSMFLYRYLPLPATLLEGKPISYKMELASTTFFLETILFFVGSLAFYIASKKRKNNRLQIFLAKQHFFHINANILWMMGAIGILVRLATFANTTETGDVGGKFLNGLVYFQWAPLVLFFPKLLRLKDFVNRNYVIIYFIFLTILNIASNSRQSIIAPFFLLVILFCLQLIKSRKNLTDFISPLKLVLLIIGVNVILNVFANLSLAMLSTRSIRSDVSKSELFSETLSTLLDSKKMAELRKGAKKLASTSNGQESYNYAGWTEEYLDNFMLNRYANIKITDITLYYVNSLGFANINMQKSLENQLWATFPDPILKILKVNIDKDEFRFSRGDKLFAEATHSPVFAGYRVTSHVADGLATFGFLYFPVQFLAWITVFYLLNCFVWIGKNKVYYAPFALINLFVFVGMFRNANGIIADFSYLLRGFWQSLFTYFVVFYFCFYTLKIFRLK